MSKTELLNKLWNDDYLVQKEAIRCLTKYNEPDVVKELAELLLRNKNKMIEDILMEALKSMGGTCVIANMLALLGHPEAGIRSFAFELLMAIGDQNIQLIAEQANHPDRNVRKFIVDILGALKSKESIDVLIAQLDDEDVNVVQGAVEALGNIGDQTVARKLIEILPVSQLWVQYTILDVLANIGDDETYSAILQMPWEFEDIILNSIFGMLRQKGRKEHTTSLLELYSRINLQTQIEVMDTILSIAQEEDIKFVSGALSNKNIMENMKDSLINGSQEIKQRLLEFLAAKDDYIACLILSESLFTGEVLAVLQEAFSSNENMKLKTAAFKCLKYYANESIIEIVINEIIQENSPLDDIALEMVGSKQIGIAIPFLLEKLDQGWKELRVIEVLGMFPPHLLPFGVLYDLLPRKHSLVVKIEILKLIIPLNLSERRLTGILSELLGSESIDDEQLLQVIAMVLQTNSTELASPLEALVNSSNIEVALAAMEAVKALRGGSIQ